MIHTRRSTSSAFTLIELLVVIGIIVVVVLLTLPVLNVLQGNRSADAAQNQIQALLNEARMIAIGLQRDAGVMFYIDPSTRRVHTVLVQGTDAQPADSQDVEVYLDLVKDHESVPMTLGMELQVMDNATVAGNPPSRSDDGYIGFNTDNPGTPATIAYGGVILFDSHGHLVSRSYGFRLGYPGPPGPPAGPPTWSEMGRLLALNQGPTPPPNDFIPGQNFGVAPPTTTPLNPPAPTSAFGLVIFSSEAFKGQDHRDDDSQGGGSGFFNQKGQTLPGYSGPEQAEELWIDQNSVPLIINRYNGTLIRGE
jgi:type II secretory pathway pseudopilin PulG